MSRFLCLFQEESNDVLWTLSLSGVAKRRFEGYFVFIVMWILYLSVSVWMHQENTKCTSDAVAFSLLCTVKYHPIVKTFLVMQLWMVGLSMKFREKTRAHHQFDTVSTRISCSVAVPRSIHRHLCSQKHCPVCAFRWSNSRFSDCHCVLESIVICFSLFPKDLFFQNFLGNNASLRWLLQTRKSHQGRVYDSHICRCLLPRSVQIPGDPTCSCTFSCVPFFSAFLLLTLSVLDSLVAPLLSDLKAKRKSKQNCAGLNFLALKVLFSDVIFPSFWLPSWSMFPPF